MSEHNTSSDVKTTFLLVVLLLRSAIVQTFDLCERTSCHCLTQFWVPVILRVLFSRFHFIMTFILWNFIHLLYISLFLSMVFIL